MIAKLIVYGTTRAGRDPPPAPRARGVRDRGHEDHDPAPPGADRGSRSSRRAHYTIKWLEEWLAKQEACDSPSDAREPCMRKAIILMGYRRHRRCSRLAGHPATAGRMRSSSRAACGDGSKYWADDVRRDRACSTRGAQLVSRRPAARGRRRQEPSRPGSSIARSSRASTARPTCHLTITTKGNEPAAR